MEELIDSWMKDVQGFDDKSASLRDLLYVQIKMVDDSWFAGVDVHIKTDSRAAASSS